MMITDEVLIHQAQEGNERAFSLLVERYQERVLNVCFRIVGNMEDAEEATMDTFLACYRSLGSFEGRSSFATWLYRITLRSSYKLSRKSPEYATVEELDDNEVQLADNPYDLLQGQEIRSIIEQAIESLPDHLKEVVIFYFLEGLSYQEIAEILECPIGTIGSRINKARKKLQAKLIKLNEEC